MGLPPLLKARDPKSQYYRKELNESAQLHLIEMNGSAESDNVVNMGMGEGRHSQLLSVSVEHYGQPLSVYRE